MFATTARTDKPLPPPSNDGVAHIYIYSFPFSFFSPGNLCVWFLFVSLFIFSSVEKEEIPHVAATKDKNTEKSSLRNTYFNLLTGQPVNTEPSQC